MDITFGQLHAELRGRAAGVRGVGRSVLLAVLLGSLAVWGATTAFAAGSPDGFAHEPISLVTDRGAMFSLASMAPGETETRYVTVASTGSARSLRMFATVAGTGLARFLTVRVTRGTGGAGAFLPFGNGGAGSFLPSGTGGAGAGVVFRGRLSAFPTTWATGLDLGAAAEPGRTETFRVEIRLAEDAGAQGLTAGADFHWEARAS
jgi:hypothetical protein